MSNPAIAEAPAKQDSRRAASANISGLPAGTRQQPMALVTPVKPASVEDLRARLQQLRADLDNGIPAAFESLCTIHYLRIVLMDPEEDMGQRNRDTSTNLVFATDYDGEEDAHLTAFSATCADFMDGLYSCCEGYPEGSARTPASRKAYFEKARVKPSAFFAGAPGRSLQQIKQESLLRNFVWSFIHSGNWAGKSPVEIHQSVKAAVAANPDFQWAKQKANLPKPKWGGMALLGIILLILLPFIIIWILVLHFVKERSDKPLGLTPSQIDRDHIRKLEEYEDWHNQNQFTQLLVMKPGFMRLVTLKGLMLFAKSLIAFLFVDGKLMGIPTIHFARWQMLDNNRRMIFFSNFDGSWTQYLGDFIDKSGWGLTGIWSNTMFFPKTNFLFTGGAYDAEHFLAWSRYYQIPTSVWYCAYPNLSIKNVMNNTHIRNGLSENLSAEKAQEFLSRI